MTTLETVAQKLRLLPPEQLTVIDDFVEFLRSRNAIHSSANDSWPPDFFETTMGALADDPTFIRHNQGEYEQREPLP